MLMIATNTSTTAAPKMAQLLTAARPAGGKFADLAALTPTERFTKRHGGESL